MMASTFSSCTRRLNSETCFFGPPPSSTTINFIGTPPIPPSLFHLATSHSLVPFPEMPKTAAPPEKKSTNAILICFGAPFGAALAVEAGAITIIPANNKLRNEIAEYLKSFPILILSPIMFSTRI